MELGKGGVRRDNKPGDAGTPVQPVPGDGEHVRRVETGGDNRLAHAPAGFRVPSLPVGLLQVHEGLVVRSPEARGRGTVGTVHARRQARVHVLREDRQIVDRTGSKSM